MGTLLFQISVVVSLIVCPECAAKRNKEIAEKAQQIRDLEEAQQVENVEPQQVGNVEPQQVGNVEEPQQVENVEPQQVVIEEEKEMKYDPVTKHYICKKCGLYATREQISDIKERLDTREKTREDKQYEYLDWWQSSKKDKQRV